MKNTMREAVRALTSGDTEKMCSYLADDASWTGPESSFKGKAELRSYATWLIQTIPDLSAVDSGIKTMAQGNSGIYEHIFSGTFAGLRMKANIELQVRKAVSEREAARTGVYHAVQRARIESHRTCWH